jgi:putative flippase GtrA
MPDLAGAESQGPFGLRGGLIRYLCVGVANTCVGLGVIYAAMYFLRLGTVQANVLGYAVGITCSFALNRSWSFASRGPVLREFARFLLVVAIAYLLNLGTVTALVHFSGIDRYLAQCVGILPYTAVGYLGSRHFAFRVSCNESTDH